MATFGLRSVGIHKRSIACRIFSTIEITSDYNSAITAIRNVFMKGRQGQKSNLIRLRDESIIHMINSAIITKFIIQNITIKNEDKISNLDLFIKDVTPDPRESPGEQKGV